MSISEQRPEAERAAAAADFARFLLGLSGGVAPRGATERWAAAAAAQGAAKPGVTIYEVMALTRGEP